MVLALQLEEVFKEKQKKIKVQELTFVRNLTKVLWEGLSIIDKGSCLLDTKKEAGELKQKSAEAPI